MGVVTELKSGRKVAQVETVARSDPKPAQKENPEEEDVKYILYHGQWKAP